MKKKTYSFNSIHSFELFERDNGSLYNWKKKYSISIECILIRLKHSKGNAMYGFCYILIRIYVVNKTHRVKWAANIFQVNYKSMDAPNNGLMHNGFGRKLIKVTTLPKTENSHWSFAYFLDQHHHFDNELMLLTALLQAFRNAAAC